MSQPLKILKVCAIDATAWILLRTQMEGMLARGWKVHVACSSGKYVERLNQTGIGTFNISIERSTNIFSHLASIWSLYKLIRRERFDIVHVHTPVASLIGRLAAKLARVPLVLYTAHGFYFHEEMTHSQKMRHIWLERAFGKLTDHLFTQSAEDALTAIEEHIMSPSTVTCIGNGIFTEKFAQVASTDIESWKSRLGIPSGMTVIGIVGRLVEEKGYREYFQAAAIIRQKFPNVAFLVVGSGLEGDRDTFHEEVARLVELEDLSERTYFTGFTEDIPELMNLMDIFALPSYREGMPRSIIEAMAAGKPVVATNIRGCREEVIDGVTGYLVPTKDAVALAERLMCLIRDPGLRDNMGRAGQKRANEEFHESLVVTRLITVIENLLKECKPLQDRKGI